MYSFRPVRIPDKYKHLVVACLSEGVEEKQLLVENGYINLNEAEVSVLRWQTIKFLNNLESVMSAWRHNTATQKIIEEEFGYLLDTREGGSALEEFRNAAGGEEAFPAIAEFVKHLKSSNFSISPGRFPSCGIHLGI